MKDFPSSTRRSVPALRPFARSLGRISNPVLLAELVLGDREQRIKDHLGDFGAGIVCAHPGITLAYMPVLKNHELGDIAGMADETGRTHNQIAHALAIPGILDAWRLFGHEVPECVPQVSLMGKGIGIARIWIY